MHREIEQITQCIILSARAASASARRGTPPGTQGQLFRYSVQDGSLRLQPAQAVARVGMALRAYRMRRELSQSDLARLAGVSPSAISQVERGERGLSLETLMALSGRLNVTLDELLGGEVTPDYRIGSLAPAARPEGSVLPLLDDAETGLRAYPSHCRDRRPSRPPSATKAPSSSGWSAWPGPGSARIGPSQVAPRRTLLASRRGIDAWRNVGDTGAQCLWVLRD
jgi:transcriptional regulator with XRE-family HTH domain